MPPEQIPRHVAIIPDGNRRWAREQGLSVREGHERGVQSFRTIVRHAADRGVTQISLWGLSIDNFRKRGTGEVRDLISIFTKEFTSLAHDEDIHKRNIRVRVFGRWSRYFPGKLVRAIEEAQNTTRQYTHYGMNILLAYNGTDEMIRAIRGIVSTAKQRTLLRITPKLVKKHLFTAELPPVDLLLRTGGEPHLSNGFMMWDTADAELHFSPTYWPAFTPTHFDEALHEYSLRRRKFGN